MEIIEKLNKISREISWKGEKVGSTGKKYWENPAENLEIRVTKIYQKF